MPKNQRHEDEDFDQDLEEQEDFDIEEDADGADDDADESADDKKAILDRILKQCVAEAHADINKQIESINAKVQDHDHRIENLEKTVMNLAGLSDKKQSASPGKRLAQEPSTGLDRVLDLTLGTTGRALHAVVDTVAFVGESLVDVVTLGRARVNRK